MWPAPLAATSGRACGRAARRDTHTHSAAARAHIPTGFEGTDDGVTSQRAANNGSWVVSVPDSRAAHTGGAGLYVEISKAWKVASLARLLLPRYVPRAGKEMLLHLAFWARVEKMHATDPTPSVTVAFLDLHKNYEEIGSETITIQHTDWQVRPGPTGGGHA